MRKAKSYIIALFVLASIALNMAGRWLAVELNLPVWLDSIGTVAVAYALGPVCGSIVGVTNNIIRSIFEADSAMAYAIVSVAIGVVVGVCAQKRMFRTLYGAVSTGFIAALASTVISVPVNMLLADGYTGNIWGDGVIDLMLKCGVVKVISCLIGEFYVDFADRLLTLLLLEICVLARRKYRERAKKLSPDVIAVLCVTLALGAVAPLPQAEAAADYSTYQQTIYNNENGLPGGVANDIAQTSDGVLWIGTYGGLYRYNGSSFEWMRDFESVKSVNCLYVDAQDKLWIGTNDSGVSIYIKGEIANVLDESDGLPSNVVRCIAAGVDGSFYYVGTAESLALISLSSGLSVTATVPEIVYAESIAVNSNGMAVAITDEGEMFLLSDANILAQLSCPVNGLAFTCCTFTADDELYVGTTGSEVLVYSVMGAELQLEECIECQGLTNIKALIEDDGGQMTVCADNGAGYLNAAGEFCEINTSKFNSSIDCAMFDYQGNLWFTSSRLGVMKLTPSAFTEVYGAIELDEHVVNAITEWNGSFYFGTDDGLDMANDTVTEAVENELTQQLEGVRVRSFMVDSQNRLWICTSSRGVLCVGADGTQQTYSAENGALGSKFRSALELSDGTVVLAGDSGLTYIEDGLVTRTMGMDDGLKNQRVLCLFEQADGTLLAGTDGGGIAVIQDGKVTKTLQKADGLSSPIIMRIVADPEGEGVFIVTGSGLCFMDNSGQISMLENFPYYNNYDLIACDNGSLFVTGSAGIYVVDRDELLAGGELNSTLLNSKKGLRATLTANSWNYLDDNGNLYLAGDTGVTMVNINAYDISFSTYRMGLRSVEVDGELYTPDDDETLLLDSETSRVVISPEIMDYSTSDPNVSYYLEGYDTEPYTVRLSELGSVVYTNLPSGSYVFRLSVLNSAGEVLASYAYDIEKETEFYERPGFMLYMVVMFMLTMIYIVWMLFRTQFKGKLELQKRELELAQKQLKMGSEAILTIARTVDARNPSTGQHSFRVAQYSVLIAKRLGLDTEQCEELRRAALLHDIGKVGIPDSVLNKPGSLTDEEYALMKTHVTLGGEILKNFTYVGHIVEGALYHHERYDGKGYMAGLKGEEIPLFARIIGVADAFDAMTSARIYKERQSLDYVIGELKRGRGTQFDPKCADIMLDLIAEGEVNVDQMYLESQSHSQGGGSV